MKYKIVNELLKATQTNEKKDIDLNLYLNQNKAVITNHYKPIYEINLKLNKKICDDISELIFSFNQLKNIYIFMYGGSINYDCKHN